MTERVYPGDDLITFAMQQSSADQPIQDYAGEAMDKLVYLNRAVQIRDIRHEEIDEMLLLCAKSMEKPLSKMD